MEDNTNQSPAISPNAARNNNAQMPNRLNPKAKAFIPNDKGIECEGQLQEESTSQWVNRNFGSGNVVATNRSCQDIPSQNTNTVNSFEEPTESERLLLTEGKLWEEQIEEGSEEGEIPDAM